MTPFERIKETAKKNGLSLQDTATKAGIGINTIYGWKRYVPASDKLQAVADALHVTTDYLLGNTDDPNPPKASGEKPMSKNQKLIAYSIDPDVSDEEREAIIEMVKQAMRFRKRL
ncbi:helix-turn-helix domain-containing protein [Lacticaseibacillus sp. N501-2]|uniref:helix-turn-helix domain-containing protein n=1 Tax=Lacticaseibacillus salsurae TaxID=3367729 RepID=UPI0038B2FB2C